MKSPIVRCPVPFEQQPLNEYEDMRESWFYSWGSRSLRGYITPVVVLWSLSWIVVGPVASASFAPAKYPAQFGVSAAIGALIMPTLALLQLYTGWSYVSDRLRQQTVPYEESGWYDGQIWVKPDEVLNRDRLIVDYQIKPIIRRIQKTFGALAVLLITGAITWQFV